MDLLTPIVLLPLLGFLVNGVVGGRLPRQVVSMVGCGLPILAFAAAVRAVLALEDGGSTPIIETAWTWATVGDARFELALYLDRLSAVMVLIITGIGSLIHVYSTGYMKDDPGYARYFAYLNLFLFFMLLLVLGRSLLLCFVGWEGVGLASYLLIGFWFSDPAKAAAGRKAFVTNRIGDAGFLLAMFLAFAALGTLDMDAINAAHAGDAATLLPAGLLGLLLFIGATGKSAQIPLHVWLPDAMAGPTPVSALIHAATMVTAGVYLVARLHGVYADAAAASMVVAWIGVLTAFFAATIAVVQTDIKKVLAYSTISQLGFMFLALGVGAYGVAVFHLATHAFFKACLFLGAGSVIHALGGEQDIRRMGDLARRIPVTFGTFAVATAAIAGLPPLAGFWSKDEILWFALASGSGGSVLLWALGTTTALLTAFYMFRLLWLVFLSPARLDALAAAHVHESPAVMTVPLVALAGLSIVGGYIPIPAYLAGVLPAAATRADLHALHGPLLGLAVAIALAGLALAWWLYRDGLVRAGAIAARWPALHRLLVGKYRIDEAYHAVLARPLEAVSARVFLAFGDRTLIDGSLHGIAALARGGARGLSRLQAGRISGYVLMAAIGLAGSLAWILVDG